MEYTSVYVPRNWLSFGGLVSLGTAGVTSSYYLRLSYKLNIIGIAVLLYSHIYLQSFKESADDESQLSV